jgi:hypothetical protein
MALDGMENVLEGRRRPTIARAIELGYMVQ